METSKTQLLESKPGNWEEMFHAIARGVDEAIVVRRPGGHIIYANDQAACLLGFSSVSELLATPIELTNARFEFYTEEGEVIRADKLPGILALRGTEMTSTVMRFRQLLTGEERWAEVKAIPIRDGQGNVQYAASIFSDMTERRRAQEALKVSEARFQTFMENSPIVAFIKDEEGRFVYVNPQFERAFQVRAAEVIGVRDTHVVPEDVAQRIHEDDMEVTSTGTMKQLIEVIPAPDGILRTWLTFKFPMTLPPQPERARSYEKSASVRPAERHFVAGASIEITDRVQAQQELQEYAERLQSLSRQLIEAHEAERRRIARDLHDQIGQVLTAVKIDLQVAQRQVSSAMVAREGEAPDGPRQQGLATSVHRLDQSISMVDHAIHQVRAFSLDLRPSMLDDLGLASAILWYVEEQARRAGLQPDLAIEQLDTRLPGEIEITCFRVAQEAITNVVRHAKASRLRVELRRSGQELELVVADDGRGLPQMRNSEFGIRNRDEPGDIPHSEGAPASQVSNLGLAGMYERMRLVGGQLCIESEPGKGTIVRAVFPLVEG